MIAHDQILPSLYQLQRLGRIGEITVCASRRSTVESLASAEGILRAFPGQTFRSFPESGGPPQPELYRSVIERMAPRQIVIVAVPDQLHYDVIMAALRHDQHVCSVKPLVLERRSQPGGAAVTEEFHPGFRCSTLAHTAGPIRPDIVRDMQLARHGLKLITPEVATVALSPDGRALTLYNDAKKSAQEISKFSQKDAAKYPEFEQSLAKIAKGFEVTLSELFQSVE